LTSDERIDPLNQQEFDWWSRRLGMTARTVFLSSHVLSEVEKDCTRVASSAMAASCGLAEFRGERDQAGYEITIHVRQLSSCRTFKALDGVAEVESLDHGRGVRLAMQGPLTR